jgi:spermidine/putrescine transport system substrate-binding protein
MADQERPYTDPIVMQRAMKHRLTRRSMLKGAGMGVAGFSVASFLAACGGANGGGGGGGGGGTNTDVFSQKPGDTVNFENWPLYIDQAKDKNGNVYHPSMEAFTKSTGINVNYNDGIQSNEEFFGKIQPQLANGDPIPYDIIVITNGSQFNVLVANDWIYTLDHSKTPNFNANAAPYAADPSYDPGAKHSMAWQGGFTGIGFNTEKVSRPITKMDDLANPDVVGTNSVGMLKADMPDFVMINLGIDPTTSGPDEWKEAADWLEKQKASGTVRQYYDQGYIDDFTSGNTSATMAWSGDVLYYKYWAGYPQLEFTIPDGGALQWQDNMMIPVGAANPAGALQLMDWVYKPDIAKEITEWVIYLSPVEGVQDLIKQDAKAAEADNAKGYANKLNETANSQYAFPDSSTLSQTKFGTNITTDAQLEEWNNIFLPISQG